MRSPTIPACAAAFPWTDAETGGPYEYDRTICPEFVTRPGAGPARAGVTPTASAATPVIRHCGAPRALALLLSLPLMPASAAARGTPPDAALAHARALLRVDAADRRPQRPPVGDPRAPGRPLDVDALRSPRHHAQAHRSRAAEDRQVGAQFWSVYIPGEIKDSGYARVQLEQFDIARRMIAHYPDRLALALTADDIERRRSSAGGSRRCSGMEGGHAIENSLGALRVVLRPRRALHDADPQRHARLGRRRARHRAARRPDGVRRGGRARDEPARACWSTCRTSRPATMSDALDVAEAPVIFSHSAARALVDHPRNVPDSILARLPTERRRRDGDVRAAVRLGRVSRPGTTRSRRRSRPPRRPSSDTAEARRRVEAWQAAHPTPGRRWRRWPTTSSTFARWRASDHVGIGSDFDGIDYVPAGLEDVSKFPDLFAELIRRGWSDADLKKLAGQNLLRALRAGRGDRRPAPARARAVDSDHRAGRRRAARLLIRAIGQGRCPDRPTTSSANAAARPANRNH